jgi:acyl-CoA thioesterase
MKEFTKHLLLYVSDMGLLGAAVNPHGSELYVKEIPKCKFGSYYVVPFGRVNFNNWVVASD